MKEASIMNDQQFRAMVVEETTDNKYERQIKLRDIGELPHGNVLVRVHYSSLNYKDALSATGNKGVTRKYPHTPGIDAAGIVEESDSDAVAKGDAVIVTSYDLGMNTSGGFGQYIRVPSDWVVKLPDNLSLKESMVYGTAGFTAGLSVYEIVENLDPNAGDVLVTGATGGVGSMAVAILSKLGFSVAAATGKTDAESFLTGLGARRIVSRQEVMDDSNRPLLKGAWAGVVDTVGGDILATAIKAAHAGGTVTCCGNVASPNLPLTVFPFILRGVRLMGIDSQNCPMDHRAEIWQKLSTDWKFDRMETIYQEVGLDDLNPYIDKILKGGITGRIVVNSA
jgi:putative YhdH/YhfP family quinone oxidoreductase